MNSSTSYVRQRVRALGQKSIQRGRADGQKSIRRGRADGQKSIQRVLAEWTKVHSKRWTVDISVLIILRG